MLFWIINQTWCLYFSSLYFSVSLLLLIFLYFLTVLLHIFIKYFPRLLCIFVFWNLGFYAMRWKLAVFMWKNKEVFLCFRFLCNFVELLRKLLYMQIRKTHTRFILYGSFIFANLCISFFHHQIVFIVGIFRNWKSSFVLSILLY